MTIRDMLRGLLGKRREDATPSSKATPAQPTAAKEVTEQELEQVQGGWGSALPQSSTCPVPADRQGLWDPVPRAVGNPTILSVVGLRHPDTPREGAEGPTGRR
jgi:bacteriocin-like protein